MGTASLGELAVRFGCTLQGDPDIRVAHVATLERADPQSLTFLANPRYRRYLPQTKAGAVVLDAASAADCPVPALIAKNPYAVYARIAALLHPALPVIPGRHATAAVDPSAVIDPTAAIGAFAVIGARVRIGARCAIGPACVLLDDVTIGADTRLVANVTLCNAVVFGAKIAYLNEMQAGEVAQLNVVPHFEADMPLTIASLAGRPISATTTLVAAIIRESIAA